MTSIATPTITLRSSSADDHDRLADLAALDSSRLRDSSYLLAVDGDEIVAAVGSSDGSIIANPFRFTEAAVELLRNRREQLLVSRHAARTRRPRRILFARHTAGRAA